MDKATQDRILDFWFGEMGPNGDVAPEKQSRWWKKSDDFDNLCRGDFEQPLASAANGSFTVPSDSPRGILAYIILCDQLSRNMYRGTPKAFATDKLALAATKTLVRTGALETLSPVEKSFALMPLMHSEDRSDQEESVLQFSKLKEEGKDNLDYAVKHKEIIDKFGRYPHRNAILGRQSTLEEVEFLSQPGSSF